MTAATTSAQIHAEIYNHGAALFEAVHDAVLNEGTYHEDAFRHATNRKTLTKRVAKVLSDAIPSSTVRDPNRMWQAIWPRIVYAGTRSGKATAEIDSMRRLVPMFEDLRHFDPSQFRFDASEWAAWLASGGGGLDPDRYFRITTPQVWKILTKDPETYGSLRFSALVPKVRKYLDVATLLHGHVGKAGVNALHLFTGGREFAEEHQIGPAWQAERASLAQVQDSFEKRLGQLTALHTMMDLGLKTIKPDRVMTRLFSEAGWLRTLPAGTPAGVFAQVYTRRAVVREMTVRADVLAKALVDHGVVAGHGLAPGQAHRLLDIWFVKYGQEPEPAFGITVNLQARTTIRELLSAVKATSGLRKDAMTEARAAQWWPLEQEFEPVRRLPKQKDADAGRKARTGRCR